MARKNGGIPKLRRHKGSGQGMARLSGVDHWCGVWPEGQEKPPEAVRAAYDRAVAEWLARGRTPALVKRRAEAPAPPENGQAPEAGAPTARPALPAALTVAEALAAYLRHARGYYVGEDGEPTNEHNEIILSIRPVFHLYALLPAAEYSPLKLKAARQLMVAGYEHPRHGKQPKLARRVVNQRVGRIKRAFAWLASEEIVPPAVPHGLATVKGLAAGRTEARETEDVKPVEAALVERTLPLLPPHAAGLVRFMLATGCRPGEACRLSLGEVDRTGPVWLYSPSRHKTKHRGKRRVVAIGPKGQEALSAFIKLRCPECAAEGRPSVIGSRDGALCGPCFDRVEEGGICGPWQRIEAQPAGKALFSPALQREESYAARRAARKTPVQPSQRNRKKSDPARQPSERYRAEAVAHAVAKACKKHKLDHWHPNQLRHTQATEARRLFGLEAAQAILGHARADVTQVYAERDLGLAVRVAGVIG